MRITGLGILAIAAVAVLVLVTYKQWNKQSENQVPHGL